MTPRWAAAPVALGAVLALGGCIGAVDRHDFNRLVEQRGGGLVSALPQGGIAALRSRLGVSDFNVVSVSLTASGQRADFYVRQPGRPDREDSYSYAQGRLGAPNPVRLPAGSADDDSFPISQATALGRVEEVVDAALAKTGFENARVTTVAVALADGDIRVTAQVDSPRSAAAVLFDKTGAFVRVQPW